jgi:hypothetical protein
MTSLTLRLCDSSTFSSLKVLTLNFGLASLDMAFENENFLIFRSYYSMGECADFPFTSERIL